MIKRSEDGYLMLEVLVALTVLAVSLVALVSRVSDSIAVNRFSREKALATRLSQESVEWLVSSRDVFGWEGMVELMDLDFPGDSVTYCLSDLPDLDDISDGSCGSTTIPNTDFVREIEVEALGSGVSVDGIAYRSVVTLDFGRRTEDVVFEGRLRQWSK